MKKTKKMRLLEKEKEKKRDKIIFAVLGSIFLLAIILGAITRLPFSGDRYEKGVLKQLHDKYKKDFVVVGRNQIVENEYQALKVSPANDRECVFIAKETTHKKLTHRSSVEQFELEDDYLVQKYIQYAPEIYFKNTGMAIDKNKLAHDYQTFIEPSTRSRWLFAGSTFFLESGLVAVKDVNINNVEQKAQIMTNIYNDLLKKEPFSNFVKYDNDEKFRRNFDFDVYYQTTKGDMDNISLSDIYDKGVSEENVKSMLEYILER